MNKNALDKRRLDDAKEHLRIIKNELNVASNELSSVLSELNDAREELANVMSKASADKIRAVSMLKEANERLAIADQRELEIQEHEKEVRKQEQNFKDKKVEKEKELREIETQHQRYLAELSNEIEDQEDERNRLSLITFSMEEGIEELEDKRSKILDETRKIEAEEKLVRESMLQSQKEYNRFLEQKQAESDAIVAEINSNKDKIAMPLQKLALEEFRLDKKKRNLDILIKRFRKEFKKLHPNIEPKI